jgi:hypothetical protein
MYKVQCDTTLRGLIITIWFIMYKRYSYFRINQYRFPFYKFEIKKFIKINLWLNFQTITGTSK